MANSIADKLQESWKKLPNAMNGNGQNFIFLLKELLGDLTAELNSKFEEISKISNSITKTPETIDEQLKNCKVKEVRVGTDISLILTWDYSDIKNYESAEIYIKERVGDISTSIDWSTVDVSRTIRTTKTNTYTVSGINAGYVYQITFVGKNNLGSVSKKDNAPVITYAVNALNNVPDPPLEFDVYFNRNGVLWKWKQPDNLDYSYSELRTNQDVGNKVGLLEVTQDTKSTVLPPTREGTAYLYNKGYGSKYSTPLDKEWSKPIPTAPQSLTVTSTYQGLQFTYSKIPEDCIGICISINGDKHYSQDDKYNFYCSTGTYTIKACFYDIFGEGIWTEEQTIGTEEEIPPDAVHITKKTVFDDGVIVGKYIGDKEIVGTKIQDGTITTDNLAANSVTAGKIATNAVTADKVETGAITADKIDAGAVTADKVGAGAITAEKIGVGAVTANKLAANEIKLAGALKVVGGLVTFDENGLSCGSSDGSKVIFNNSGMSFIDKNGNPYNIVNQTCIGTAKHGQHVQFANEWPSAPNVAVFPMQIVTSNPVYSTSEVTFHCYATNITKSGFDMKCYAGIKNADGVQSLNYNLMTKTAGRKPGVPVDKEGDNGTSWSWESQYVTTASLDGNVSVSISSDNTGYWGKDDWVGSFQIWPHSDYYAYVNNSQVAHVHIDFSGLEFDSSYGGNGSIGKADIEGQGTKNATLNFYANKGSKVTIKEVHYGNLTAGHGRGYYKHTTTIKTITWSFSGEQALDSNGVGGFIATIGNNNNFTVS